MILADEDQAPEFDDEDTIEVQFLEKIEPYKRIKTEIISTEMSITNAFPSLPKT